MTKAMVIRMPGTSNHSDTTQRHDHVQEVKEGHREIEHVKQIGAQVDALLVVVGEFTRLQHQEDRTHQQRGQQPADQPARITIADVGDPAHHEVAAGDQGQGVEQRGVAVQGLLVLIE